jgi:hypothetical protein
VNGRTGQRRVGARRDPVIPVLRQVGPPLAPASRIQRIERHLNSTWCQFHRYFTSSFFVLKFFAQLLRASNLGL